MNVENSVVHPTKDEELNELIETSLAESNTTNLPDPLPVNDSTSEPKAPTPEIPTSDISWSFPALAESDKYDNTSVSLISKFIESFNRKIPEMCTEY